MHKFEYFQVQTRVIASKFRILILIQVTIHYFNILYYILRPLKPRTILTVFSFGSLSNESILRFLMYQNNSVYFSRWNHILACWNSDKGRELFHSDLTNGILTCENGYVCFVYLPRKEILILSSNQKVHQTIRETPSNWRTENMSFSF